MGDDNKSIQQTDPAGKTDPAVGTKPKAGDTLTQADVDAAVKSAVDAAKAEWTKTLEGEKKRAAELAKMTAEQRTKAEFEDERKKFEADRAKHEAEHREFECTRSLAAEGLPTDFAKMLTGSTTEETAANIAAFKTAFAEAVEAKVTERLKGTNPKGFGGGNTNPTASDGFFDIINESHR